MNLRTRLRYSASPRLAALMLFSVQASAQDGILHEGTPIRLEVESHHLLSERHLGDTVDFEVLDDVKAGDVIVVPHGSTALATVTEAVPKGRMGKGGKLNVNVDFVRLPNGEKLPLRGVQENKGGSHTGVMTGAMVGTAIVFWPAAPFFLMMHGKDITVPQGHEVTVYTNTEYKSEALIASLAPGIHSGAAGAALTNADVLKLKQAGLGEQILVAKIKNAPGAYKLDTDDLVKLKSAGISDAVIAAMLDAKR